MNYNLWKQRTDHHICILEFQHNSCICLCHYSSQDKSYCLQQEKNHKSVSNYNMISTSEAFKKIYLLWTKCGYSWAYYEQTIFVLDSLPVEVALIHPILDSKLYFVYISVTRGFKTNRLRIICFKALATITIDFEFIQIRSLTSVFT